MSGAEFGRRARIRRRQVPPSQFIQPSLPDVLIAGVRIVNSPMWEIHPRNDIEIVRFILSGPSRRRWW
jgi:hypothetical protein